MKVIITFTFCCYNLWKSEVYDSGKVWKTQGIFLSYFVATLSYVRVLVLHLSVLCATFNCKSPMTGACSRC